ncbi:hypothetical protein Tamer19_06480 [Cupriavidus sp. TA19]|nr:hypothetical protein Tamer19_06480 [Cupriavidus sp. TA19]
MRDGKLVCGYYGLEMECEGKTISMPLQRVGALQASAVFPWWSSMASFGSGRAMRRKPIPR